MSEDTFRLCVVVCLVVIAGTMLGGLVAIGMNLDDIADALKAMHR